MKNTTLLLSLLLQITIFSHVFAQNGRILNIEEAVMGQVGTFAPATLTALQWRPQTAFYTYASGDSLIQTDARSGKTSLLLTLKQVNDALAKEKLSKIPSIAYVAWKSTDHLTIYAREGKVFFDVIHKKIDRIHRNIEGAAHVEESSVEELLAYTVENNLYIRKPDGETIQLTHDAPMSGIVNGQVVHRNEFGITKGIFWSPQADFLAFYRMDESMVTDYPLVDITARTAELNSTKYPMAGMASHEVTLGIYNMNTGKTVFMKTGEPTDQYLTGIAWAPDAKSVYIALLNRDQNHLRLNEYDATSGELLKTLFEEKNNRYVEPAEPMLFMKTRPDEFIWQSQRDGHNHLYLYNRSGKLITQLTKGEWDVTEIAGFDSKENTVYYVSTQESPLQRHLYTIDMKSVKTILLTAEHGTHHPVMNINEGYFIDRITSTDVPLKIDLCRITGKIVRNLLTAENPYKDIAMPEMEMITLIANDGVTPLYGRLIKPLKSTGDTKHPVIVYVYGGPHAQLVTDTWLGGARLWEYYMAQKGYAMFTLDNRGSSGRGFNFESVIHRRLGELELHDQLTGVNYLKKLPYIDTTRIGVHGWSFGGFMTTNMMLNVAETFKVGVAGGPVMDWSLYEVMYGERYMDMPALNPEGYARANMISKASQLKGKLLLIHGDIDNVVVMQHSLQFIRECVSNNIPIDFFVYPQHKHNVVGKDRIHLMQKITDYFDSNL